MTLFVYFVLLRCVQTAAVHQQQKSPAKFLAILTTPRNNSESNLINQITVYNTYLEIIPKITLNLI